MSLFRKSFYTGTVLQIVTCPIHLMAHFSGYEPANEQERQLLGMMESYKQDFGAGFVRSFRDLFTGLSLQYSIFMLMVGAMNWLAVRRAKDASFLRLLSWLNAAFMAVLAVNAYRYFFLPPLLLFALPAIAFLLAAWSAPGAP
jgi:hypothetical protein